MKVFGIGTSTDRRASPEGRRVPKFVESLSRYFIWIGALGCAYVIIDPTWHFAFGDYFSLSSSGDGFSSDTKGMVVGIAIVGTLVAVQKFWLPGTDEGKKQAESMSRIAEAPVAPVAPGTTTITPPSNITVTTTEGATDAKP